MARLSTINAAASMRSGSMSPSPWSLVAAATPTGADDTMPAELVNHADKNLTSLED